MTVQRVIILGRGGAGKSTVSRRLGKLVGLPVIELDKHFGNPAWRLCLGKSGWKCSVTSQASRAGSWMGTWVPTMPSQSASRWQIRFCCSIFRCGCVCGAHSDGAKRDGTSGGGSSRGDGSSDQNSATCSPSTQTRRYIFSVHRRNSTSFCPSSPCLAE